MNKNTIINFENGIDFQNLVSEKSIELCNNYSESSELLKEFFEQYKISARYCGLTNWEDFGDETIQITIKIENVENGKNCMYNFHMSMVDTAIVNFKKVTDGILKNKYFKVLHPFTKYSWSQLTIHEQFKVEKGMEKKKIKVKNDILYSVLCSVGMDYYYSDYSHREFCSEFGYDEDSIKTLKLYNDCKELSYKLQNVIDKKFIEAMPC